MLVAGIEASNQAQAAANVVWVSFHAADDSPSAAAAGAGFTQAPDGDYTRLLRNAGYTVTRYVTSATPDVNLLNTFDLVIISRSVPSGNYQTPESNALWHGLTKPTMVLGGYVLRASRLGYTYGEDIPDTAGPIMLTATNPDHPIFAGVTLDASGTMSNPFADLVTYNGVVQRGISVNTSAPVDGAIVLATVATESDPAFGGMIVGEFPAGTMMGNASGDITAAKRLIFLTGSREQGITGDAAGIFDLEADGVRLFLNSVAYMTGTAVVEPPPLITSLAPADGTTQHFAPVGITFRASSGTAEGIPAGNITLVLNGTDVSPSLTVTGTAQDRLVSFTNVLADTDYTGVITVRDAGGREASVNFTFDTRPPQALPSEYAYPVSAAVANASGLRARIAQTDDFATLTDSGERAEAQLAGTLIDTAIGEPYFNYITPSTDNPDGAYNQEIINWNVTAGANELGNFRAPSFPDALPPGIVHNLNFAAEIIAYLELNPGRYFMGVNSDDGFVVYTGAHPLDVFARDLGRFDGGRGSADTIFQFEVTEAGLYPFRLVYYQGTGDGNLEWFTLDPLTNEKTLINDRDNPDAVRAWREVTGERPYIASLQPGRGASDVESNAAIVATIQDAGAQVQQDSVQLTFDGQPVSAQVSKAGAITTVRYTPPVDLTSDTEYTVGLAYTDSNSNERTASYQFKTRFVPPVVATGANIVWVSFHEADDLPSGGASAAGFTEAPDIGYTSLLESAGHEVTRYLTTLTPDVDFLNTFDLVIISRSVPSSDYQSAESTALWHSVTKPAMLLGGYILRASRLGFTAGETIPDTSASAIRLTASNPSHPIFSGIPLEPSGNMVNDYAHLVTYNGTLQRGISVNTDAIAAGGTNLATVATPGDAALGGMIIGEFPAGTVMRNASADPTAGKRLVFLTGSRENVISSEGSGIYDLDSDGARLFLNAVAYMTGLELPEPSSASLNAALLPTGSLSLSWPEAGTESIVLQASPTLMPANWQPVTGTPVVANGQRTVTVETTDSARFFRLFRP